MTGETDSWRAGTKPCAHQDPGERSSDPQETDPDLPVSVQESPAEAWVNSGLPWGRGTEHNSAGISPLDPYPEAKQQERNTAPPINRKLD